MFLYIVSTKYVNMCIYLYANIKGVYKHKFLTYVYNTQQQHLYIISYIYRLYTGRVSFLFVQGVSLDITQV